MARKRKVEAKFEKCKNTLGEMSMIQSIFTILIPFKMKKKI